MDAGFLGVGAMGQPMAEKLLDGGHDLSILDIEAVDRRDGSKRRSADG